jgi:DNA polymerase alpha/epsilon subunit B
MVQDPATIALVPRPLPSPDPSDPSSSPRYVLLVSGLGFGALSNSRLASSVSPDYELCLHLLSDFVSGLTGEGGSPASSGRIARVIVAGNLLAPPLNSTSAASRTAAASATYVRSAAAPAASSSSSGAGGSSGSASSGNPGASFSDRTLSIADQELLSAPMREADLWLATLASTVPVDLMPGENDPSNFTMPQQKMHPCLFPASARYSDTFKSVSNPYELDCGGVRILGSSGQPVADVARYASSSSLLLPGNEAGVPSMKEKTTVVVSKSLGAASTTSSSSSNGNGVGASSPMDVDGAEAESGSGSHSSDAAPISVAALGGAAGAGAFEEDGLDAEALPEASVVAAVSTTAGDRAMKLLAGTGAGAGHEARIAAAVQHAAEEASGHVFETREKRLAHDPLGSGILSHTDILTNTLFWRHMAPTCPDTLSAYPFADIDPFVSDPTRLPHLLFAGGAPTFDTRLVYDKSDPQNTQVRVVSIPDFIRTKTVVLVDISKPELPVQPICFKVGV